MIKTGSFLPSKPEKTNLFHFTGTFQIQKFHCAIKALPYFIIVCHWTISLGLFSGCPLQCFCYLGKVPCKMESYCFWLIGRKGISCFYHFTCPFFFGLLFQATNNPKNFFRQTGNV